MATIGNRITLRCGSACVAPDGRPRNAGALRNMPQWSVKHRQSEGAIFGTSTDIAAMYDSYEFAEELAHDFEYISSDGLHTIVRGSDTLLQVKAQIRGGLFPSVRRCKMCVLALPYSISNLARRTSLFLKSPAQHVRSLQGPWSRNCREFGLVAR